MTDESTISHEQAGVALENSKFSLDVLLAPTNRDEHGVYSLPPEIIEHDGLNFSRAAIDGSPLQDFMTALLRGRNKPFDPNETVFASELSREQLGGEIGSNWDSLDFGVSLTNKWDTIDSLLVSAGLRHNPVSEQEEKSYKEDMYKKLMDQVEGQMREHVRLVRIVDRDDNSTEGFFLRWKKDSIDDSVTVDVKVNRRGIMISSLIGNPGNYTGSSYEGAVERWQGANIATKRMFDVVNVVAPVMA